MITIIEGHPRGDLSQIQAGTLSAATRRSTLANRRVARTTNPGVIPSSDPQAWPQFTRFRRQGSSSAGRRRFSKTVLNADALEVVKAYQGTHDGRRALLIEIRPKVGT